jgi:hypothetical protein
VPPDRIRNNVAMRPTGGRMRLLSVLFVVAAVALVAALGAVAAAAQSTGQTFETLATTGPESTLETTGPNSTTPTPSPSPEQNAGDAQANTACPGAELIASVGPTDEDLITRQPFLITGESFRLTYETTDADESGLPFVDVTVLDEAGKEVGGRVIFEEGIQQEIVRASPGRFDFETTAEDLKYKLTIEDCTGKENPPSRNQPVPTAPNPDNQHRRDIDPPNEDNVIDDTVSDRPLPDTGGVPLLGLGVFGFICVGAGFLLLGPVIRRNT